MHQDLTALIPTEGSSNDGHRLGGPAARPWFLQAQHAWGARLTSKRWVMLWSGVRRAPLGAQAGTDQLSKGAEKQRGVFAGVGGPRSSPCLDTRFYTNHFLAVACACLKV